MDALNGIGASEESVTKAAHKRIAQEVYDEAQKQMALKFEPGDPIHPRLRKSIFRLQHALKYKWDPGLFMWFCACAYL